MRERRQYLQTLRGSGRLVKADCTEFRVSYIVNLYRRPPQPDGLMEIEPRVVSGLPAAAQVALVGSGDEMTLILEDGRKLLVQLADLGGKLLPRGPLQDPE
jgi:hypothetical protein